MSEETIKLPGSSYDEVKKIIVAYTNIGKQAPLGDVARSAGMDTTIVSRNNGFLHSIGVITPGKQKEITPAGAQLGRALEYDVSSQVSDSWRQITSEIDFFKNLISSVRIRRGMEPSALRAHVAYSAGQPKSPGVLTGAGTIVEILKLSGALEEQDGKLVASDLSPPPPNEVPLTSFNLSKSSEGPGNKTSTAELISLPESDGALSIQVQIVCKPDELSGLAEKLKDFLRDLRNSESSDKDEG